MPIGTGSAPFVEAPILLAVMVLLALFMRWAFGSDAARRRRTPPAPVDDGLLARVATLSSRQAANALRAVLSDAGIRSTVRFASASRTEVLVFGEDAERARALASSFDGNSGGGLP